MTSVKGKKRLMYITFSFIFLFGGIEYAVILPTLWLYLHNTYDPPEFMLGLVLSAYSLAAFLSAPIFGRLADKVRCTKKIILLCCAFQMVGSFLYFIGISEWLCVGSRFISGLGAASEAIAVAEVSRYTTEQERTGIISNLIATRQIALLLGPALNLFLRLADFEIGPFHVTKYSAPGAFMVLMWLTLMVVVLTLYTEPNDIYSLEQTQIKPILEGATADGSGVEGDERSPLLASGHPGQNGSLQSQSGESDPYIERSFTALDDPISREGKLGFCCNEYVRDEVIAILCLLFCAMFSQICVETMVLPLSLEYLDFGELENSLLYFVCGGEIIIVFLILTRLTKCLSDRVLLMFGAATILSSNVWLLYFLPIIPKHNRAHNIPIFSVAVVLDVLSLPFLIVCSTSLYSKLTRKQTQGLSQGLRRAIVSVGTIMAPLWGSSASTKPSLLMGVLVALQGLSLILLIFSFPRLKAPSARDPSPTERPRSASSKHVQAPSDGANGGRINSTVEEEEKDYEESSEWVGRASINSFPADHSHRLTLPHSEEFFDSNSPRDQTSSTAGFQTPYGSMARSLSFRSIQSSISAGSPQRQQSPVV